MFSSVSRGIPSFGDLSWKAPAAFATDPARLWTFPPPVVSPASVPVPGQLLTASINGAMSAEAPMDGFVPTVGQRILLTSSGGTVTASDGLWIVLAVGSAGTPWQLVRATDADTPTELPDGTLVIVPEFAYDAGLFTGGFVFYGKLGASWSILPNGMTAITVIDSAAIGLGSTDPALLVTGGAVADRFLLDLGHRDVVLSRLAAKTLTARDNGGADLTLIDLGLAPVQGKVPLVTVFTAGGTWAPGAGWQYAIVEVQGGGGAGGGAAVTAAGQGSMGGGGGAGGYARKLVRRTAVTGNGTVIVGAGGTAGAAGASGNAGNLSSFAMTGITTLVGNAGSGGAVVAAGAGNAIAGGGGGGTGTGGDINVRGGAGANGLILTAIPVPMGLSGGSVLGNGHRNPASLVGAAGGAPDDYGIGGEAAVNGASQAARAGGAGGNGVVIVTEFYGP